MDSAFPNVPFYLRYDTLSLYLEAAGIVPVVFLLRKKYLLRKAVLQNGKTDSQAEAFL